MNRRSKGSSQPRQGDEKHQGLDAGIARVEIRVREMGERNPHDRAAVEAIARIHRQQELKNAAEIEARSSAMTADARPVDRHHSDTKRVGGVARRRIRCDEKKRQYEGGSSRRGSHRQRRGWLPVACSSSAPIRQVPSRTPPS